jgi:hypothetical protein
MTVTGEQTGQWLLELDLRETEAGHARGAGVKQAHLICTRDRQSVYCLAVDLSHAVAVFTVEGLAAAVMRHVREVHCDGGGNLVR